MTELPAEEHGDRSDESGDPPELDRMVDALRSAWTEVPDADRATIWSAIEGNLGPQDEPGRDPRPGFLRGAFGGLGGLGGMFANPFRQLALAGAAVAVVAAVMLGGAFRSGTNASAAVLEAVNSLSETTTAALIDDSLSSDELLLLRAEATRLLDEVEGNEGGLRGLSPEELRGVIDTLELLVLLLDPPADADLEDDDDYVSTLTSIRTSSETARGVFADFEDGDRFEDDDDAPAGLTAAAGGVVGDDDEDVEPTATPATTGTAAPTATAERDDSPEPTETPEPEETPDPEHTPEATATPDPTGTSTPEPTETATPEPTATAEPTATPEATATPDPTVEPPGTSTELIPAVAGSYQVAARGAGTVSYNYAGGALTVTDVSAAGGWSADVQESSGSEIRALFSRGLERVQVEVERQDADLEVAVSWWTVAGNG